MLYLETVHPKSRYTKIRIKRVSNFLECLSAKFSENFKPSQHICVDKSVVKFNGKISFITYNPKKMGQNGT